MEYVNCAALDAQGKYFPSKKALRDAMADHPAGVKFVKTSRFNGAGYFPGHEIPEGVTLSVVGPCPGGHESLASELACPYKHRVWFGSVTRKGGKVKVA